MPLQWQVSITVNADLEYAAYPSQLEYSSTIQTELTKTMHTVRLVADDLVAMDMSLQLTMTQLVAVTNPLKSVASRRELNPVASHHLMVNHEPQSKEDIALVCCKAT